MCITSSLFSILDVLQASIVLSNIEGKQDTH